MGTAILVVDDEQLIRWSLKQRLQQDGYEVLEAGSGAEALAFAAGRVGLVLLDLRLPDLDGRKLLDKLRDWNPGCRFILMTAQGPGAARQGDDGEVYAVVDKPFNLETMAHLAGEALCGGNAGETRAS